MAEKKRPVPIKKPKPRTKLTPTKEETLKALLAERATNADIAARIAKEQKALNERILEIVEELDGADETWEGEDVNGRHHRATVVRPTSTLYDVDYLKGHVSPRIWTKITDEVLNVKALEDAVVDGSMDAEIAFASRSEEPKKAYVRITTK